MRQTASTRPAYCGAVLPIAVRKDGAQAQIFVDVVGHASREQIRAGYVLRRKVEVLNDLGRHGGIPGLYIECGDIPLADTPTQLDSAIDRNLLTIQQAHVATEERNELFIQAKSKIVLIRSLQKKRPLLREEQGKAGEVDLPRIDLGFGKVSV